jgi:outer membrane protein TolC
MTRSRPTVLVSVAWLLIVAGEASPGGYVCAQEQVSLGTRITDGLLPAGAGSAESLPVVRPGGAWVLDGFVGKRSLEDVVAYARANNAEIQAARCEACAVREKVPQEKSLPDPELMTTAFLVPMQFFDGQQNLTLELAQRFPWFGKRSLRGQRACQDAAAAYARSTSVELQVIERVKRAYFDVYYLGHAVAVTRALEPRLDDVIQISRTRYEANAAQAGLESVLEAQTELSNLKLRQIELEEMKAEAQARLAAALHLSPATRIEAEDNLLEGSVAQPVEALVTLADSCQPELSARRAEVCRDQAAVDLARKDYYPDMRFAFDWYQMSKSPINPASVGNDSYSITVGVNLPIYRQRIDAEVREAQFKAAQTSWQYQQARDQARAEIQAIHAQFVQQDQALKIVGGEVLPRARQAFELSIDKYRVGRVEFQQLIANYQSLRNAEIDYYNRQTMRAQAVAALERAVGCAVASWTSRPDGDRPPGR